jgi:hypothetical protein
MVLNSVRCMYCARELQNNQLVAHWRKCLVRAAALIAKATLGRPLTYEEIAAIRGRF